MYPYLLAVFAILAYILYLRVKKQLNYFAASGVPHTPGWPLFGNMLGFCFSRQHLNDLVRDLYNSNREAKYVGAFNFTAPLVMLRDLELIKSVTIRHFDRFCDRPLSIDATTDPIFGGNLFVMPGERWRQFKAMVSPAFTTSKIKTMHELIVASAVDFVQHLGDSSLECVDAKDVFSRVTNDAIVSCAFGLSTDSFSDRENQVYVLGKEATRLSGVPLMKMVMIGMFPRLSRWLRVRLVGKRTADFFIGMVENVIREREERGTVRPDMIQLMMNARETDDQLDAAMMTAQAFTMYFGGFDTVSTQLCLLAHELAINPQVQRRLQVEIDAAMRRNDGKLTYEDLQEMPYLDATFQESIRLHTQFPFLERMCIKALELPPALPGGEPFAVQPGTIVWVPAAAINRDSSYYDEPDKFDPDRYYGKRGNVSEMPNLGFGMGPRGCLGGRFAALETKILLAYLLGKFNVLPTEKTSSPLVYDTSSLPLRAVGGFFFKFVPRY